MLWRCDPRFKKWSIFIPFHFKHAFSKEMAERTVEEFQGVENENSGTTAGMIRCLRMVQEEITSTVAVRVNPKEPMTPSNLVSVTTVTGKGGDEKTFRDSRSAQRAMRASAHTNERLQGLHCVHLPFHAFNVELRSLLREFYHLKSRREPCTLSNLAAAANITESLPNSDPLQEKKFQETESFFLSYLMARVIDVSTNLLWPGLAALALPPHLSAEDPLHVRAWLHSLGRKLLDALLVPPPERADGAPLESNKWSCGYADKDHAPCEKAYVHGDGPTMRNHIYDHKQKGHVILSAPFRLASRGRKTTSAEYHFHLMQRVLLYMSTRQVVKAGDGERYMGSYARQKLMLYQADGNHNYAKAMMRCLHKQRLSGTPRACAMERVMQFMNRYGGEGNCKGSDRHLEHEIGQQKKGMEGKLKKSSTNAEIKQLSLSLHAATRFGDMHDREMGTEGRTHKDRFQEELKNARVMALKIAHLKLYADGPGGLRSKEMTNFTSVQRSPWVGLTHKAIREFVERKFQILLMEIETEAAHVQKQRERLQEAAKLHKECPASLQLFVPRKGGPNRDTQWDRLPLVITNPPRVLLDEVIVVPPIVVHPPVKIWDLAASRLRALDDAARQTRSKLSEGAAKLGLQLQPAGTIGHTGQCFLEACEVGANDEVPFDWEESAQRKRNGVVDAAHDRGEASRAASRRQSLTPLKRPQSKLTPTPR
jgi:hypothetical protein